VVIMQALIHRPKDQVYETLNVICELLPDVAEEGLLYLDDLYDAGYPGNDLRPLASNEKETTNAKRVELLKGCQAEVKRFAIILLPTLTDAYSSTVNLGVREKVLTAQLKMLSNLDTKILEEALRTVPYASFLASILSQQDHANLVTYALQAAELLLKRLESIYRYQFYREGVISEISNLANRPCKSPETKPKESKTAETLPIVEPAASSSLSGDQDMEQDPAAKADRDMHSDEDDDEDDMDEDQNENSDNQDDDDDSDSSSSSDHRQIQPMPNAGDIITLRAKKFVEAHEQDSHKPIRDKASMVLDDLKFLANEIRECDIDRSHADCLQVLTRLAAYFEGDALDSITSYELKTSKIVDVLLEFFARPLSTNSHDPRSLFIEAFMGGQSQAKIKTAHSASPATAFSALVGKLQDLLSRSEHFEVFTVQQHAYDSRGSATSMLAKQLRLNLVADEDSEIPKSYRNMMVTIHAIATFKALDDYLRPRIGAAERTRSSRTRDQIAAYAQALAEGRAPPFPHTPSDSRTAKKPAKAKSSSNDAGEAGPSSTTRDKTRRTSRRQQAQQPPPPP